METKIPRIIFLDKRPSLLSLLNKFFSPKCPASQNAKFYELIISKVAFYGLLRRLKFTSVRSKGKAKESLGSTSEDFTLSVLIYRLNHKIFSSKNPKFRNFNLFLWELMTMSVYTQIFLNLYCSNYFVEPILNLLFESHQLLG